MESTKDPVKMNFIQLCSYDKSSGMLLEWLLNYYPCQMVHLLWLLTTPVINRKLTVTEAYKQT